MDKDLREVMHIATETLEGHQRAIMGNMTIEVAARQHACTSASCRCQCVLLARRTLLLVVYFFDVLRMFFCLKYAFLSIHRKLESSSLPFLKLVAPRSWIAFENRSFYVLRGTALMTVLSKFLMDFGFFSIY